jgi:hypothetical protein
MMMAYFFQDTNTDGIAHLCGLRRDHLVTRAVPLQLKPSPSRASVIVPCDDTFKKITSTCDPDFLPSSRTRATVQRFPNFGSTSVALFWLRKTGRLDMHLVLPLAAGNVPLYNAVATMSEYAWAACTICADNRFLGFGIV